MKAIAKYLQCPEGEATAGKLGTITVAEQAYDVAKKTKDNDLIHVKLFAITQKEKPKEVDAWDKIHGPGGTCKSIQLKSGEVFINDNGTWFKKLGPLSPNATWVKEGDQIEGCMGNEFKIEIKGKMIEMYAEKYWDKFIVLGPCGYYH